MQLTGTVTNTTITAGGTAQLIPVSNVWQQAIIQNNSAGDLWIQFNGTAAIDAGIRIPTLVTWTSPVGIGLRGPISIIGATTGQKFSHFIK